MRRAVLIAVLGLLAACKGDRDKCEKACRNFGTLMYWDLADKAIQAAPPAERDALRKRKLGEFSSLLENGVDTCVNQCTSANNDKQVDCMTNAKTAADAQKCVQ